MAGRAGPEKPAKAPLKLACQRYKDPDQRAQSCDFGQSEAAAGEAATKVFGLDPNRGFTRVQTGTQGGLGMADAREVMNIRQASQYLGVSPDTLYKYVSEDKIPAFKLGNRWKFKKSLLDTWMENQSLSGEMSRPRKLTKAARAVVG